MHTTHTNGSHSQGGSHLSHKKNNKAMNGKSELLPNLISFPTMKRIVAIGANQGPLLVNLSCMMRTTIMNAEVEIHLREAWKMML